MNLEIIESVIDLIEMGAVRSEDVVKNLRSAIKDTLEQSSNQPQRTERPADCERCNRLEEQAYDLVGKLRVANIKLSMQPQRTWVDLTNDEIALIHADNPHPQGFARAILAKSKEKNT